MDEIDKFLDMRITGQKALEYLKWFLIHTLDQYLDQNEDTVIKSIKNDSPPSEIKEFIYSYELSNKNRKNVLKVLKGGE